MSEVARASTGYLGEVWLGTGLLASTLAELVQVVSFSLPSDTAERVETTHLKSPGRRREYTTGMVDGGEIEVMLNFRPGTATDLLIEGALAAGTLRAARFNVPQVGVLAYTYNTTVQVLAYDKGSVEADGKMEASVTLGVSGLVTGSAYVAP